jgi:hypothetical protein
VGEMQGAFDSYFSKLIEYYRKESGSYPTISYDEGVNKELIIGEPDKEGYVAWLPKKINTKFDFIPIEKKFKMCLNEEVKEYFTTYLFLRLSGVFEDMELDFDPISEFSELGATIERQITDARYYFTDETYLLIGSGSDGSDDSFNIFYDNRDSKLVCVSTETEKNKFINKHLSFVIQTMGVFEYTVYTLMRVPPNLKS